jgi:hypothetical protein
MVEILGKQVVKGLFWVFLFVCLFAVLRLSSGSMLPAFLILEVVGKRKKKKNREDH